MIRLKTNETNINDKATKSKAKDPFDEIDAISHGDWQVKRFCFPDNGDSYIPHRSTLGMFFRKLVGLPCRDRWLTSAAVFSAC